jgi:pyruvate carboxylase
MERCLQEFRVRGVKTNIPFLLNLVTHQEFLAGRVTTRFLDERPELFQLPVRRDRATRLLTYIGEVIVNGHPDVKDRETARQDASAQNQRSSVLSLLARGKGSFSPGTRDKLHQLGPEKFSHWVRQQERLLVTDTTFRDAHQSLLATRMRTYDMLQVAPRYAREHAGLFSLEMWGGATFDTALRFLKEDPWARLVELRECIPNILFQMLLRGSNAVGYANYPDNVVRAFVKEAAQAGIDVFRIFDALNWVPNLRLAIEAVRDSGMLCEPALCYSGDILDSGRTKYNLKYYVRLARELEKLGANLLAIKDMAGVCKPYAAALLVRTLKQEVGVPIHFHTHDCAGGQMAALLLAADEGVDIVDCAMAPLAGTTSQPSLNTLVEALRFRPRDTGLAFGALQATADYWEGVRQHYAPFESGPPAASAEVYRHEMPGGQYTNLHQQAQSLGLAERWHDVCRMYAEVNTLFGDIIKVTPTSKVVGDMALFMVANNLTPEEVLRGQRDLAFPESVVELCEGKLGQPYGGFPAGLQTKVLRGRKPLQDRPGASLPPADFDKARQGLAKQLGRPASEREVVTQLLYPRVFAAFLEHQKAYSDTSVLPTPVFFHGMAPGEEVSIDIEEGKTLILKFQTVGDPHLDGTRLVFFELNGQPREVVVLDRSLAGDVKAHPKADPANAKHIGAPMPGLVVAVAVAPGEQVARGGKLVTLEAMKMETTVYAELAGRVAEVLVRPGHLVEAGDLLLRIDGEGRS